MSERTTKEIVTPNGRKVIIFDYITGGEMRKIQALYTENLSAKDLMQNVNKENTTPGEVMMSKVPANIVMKAQEMALAFLIVSVDGGSKETAYQDALDMLPDDLTFLIARIDEYTSGSTTKKN